MGGVFISYRRSDARHAAGRLHDRLRASFDANDIFMDVDGIEPGMDFIEVLNERVGACDIVLAVIGPNWLTSEDERGRRLDHEDDFVRIELEAALARDIRVVPVLVDGARMPATDELPDSLKSLARRQGVAVRHETFGPDSEIIVGAVQRVLTPSRPAGGLAPTPAPAPVAPIPPAPVAVSAERIRAILIDSPQTPALRIGLNIKPEQERNLRNNTGAQTGEIVIAIYDLTVFGNANDGVLFTDTHIRHHHMKTRDAISWADFLALPMIDRSGMFEVTMGKHVWTMSGGDRGYILNVLRNLHAGLQG
ncbi:MAG: toll/interleukin-1 receptor domain-containing protein [Hyphomonadaceae bacterium]